MSVGIPPAGLYKPPARALVLVYHRCSLSHGDTKSGGILKSSHQKPSFLEHCVCKSCARWIILPQSIIEILLFCDRPWCALRVQAPSLLTGGASPLSTRAMSGRGDAPKPF